MPSVSIITPSFRSKKFINQTLQSIKNQTFGDFEVLIVDDASPDGSADYIASILPDERFQLIRLNANLGAGEARNVGLRNARGRYIAFLDADDLWMEDKLEQQLEFMAKNDAALTFSAYEVISEDGELVTDLVPVPELITKHQYLRNTVIGCLTVVLDKEKFSQEIAMPNLRTSQDVALWVSLLNEIEYAHGLPNVLASYRVVKNSNTSNKFRVAKDMWFFYRVHLGIGLIESLSCFAQYAFNAITKRKYRWY